MASGTEATRVVPLTCHGHSRPITHISFSALSQTPRETPQSSSSSTPAAYYLISACKDNNPMLRDGTTGDWIGTFIGHKGAVWSSRLSSDASLAITGSADFTARVWDTFTGECRAVLPHNHIVRAVAFAPPLPSTEPGQPTQRPQRAATGGSEKRLRVWDISQVSTAPSQQPPTSEAASESTPTGETSKPLELDASTYATEIAPGAHTGTIKSVIWTSDPDVIITAADDGAIRWFDLRTPDAPVAVHTVVGTIGSCELGDGLVEATTDDTQEGTVTTTTGALLSVAAGKRIYVFDAEKKSLVKEIELGGQHEASAVALCGRSRRFVTGAAGDTWVRVWDFDTGKELETIKGHHGPVWTAAFSPDAKIAATGSEDGTIKLHKFCKEPYGLWR